MGVERICERSLGLMKLELSCCKHPLGQIFLALLSHTFACRQSVWADS